MRFKSNTCSCSSIQPPSFSADAHRSAIRPLASGLLLAAFLSSCAGTPPPPDQQGLWRAPGYNSIFEITPGGVNFIETTSISCIQSAEEDNLEELFEEKLDVMLRDPETLRIKPAIAQTGYVLNRLSDAQFDERCPEIVTNELEDPERNFEIFWKTFDENYAFFDRRGVDWQATYDRYRGKVDQETTEEDLLEIFVAMVAPLRDGHIEISADGEDTADIFTLDIVRMLTDECQIQAPPCESASDYIQAEAGRFKAILKENYLGGDIETMLDEKIFWGKLSSEVGYLHFGSAGGYTDEDSSTDDFESLQPVLDQVFTDLASFPNLIIDLRTNGGGDDTVALSLVNRLADERRLVFEKAAFENGALTSPQQAFIQPNDRSSYDGRVIALTSSVTASAAEVLTMALRELPHVTLMGTPTAGEFSDIHGRILPNGFQFGLSNEVYTSADGRIFEGEGVSPDVAHPFFLLADRQEGRDSMIDEALSMLARDATASFDSNGVSQSGSQSKRYVSR